MEEILPGTPFHRTGFQVQHIQAAFIKMLQYFVQGARFMLRSNDHGNLVRVRPMFRLIGDDDEPGAIR